MLFPNFICKFKFKTQIVFTEHKHKTGSKRKFADTSATVHHQITGRSKENGPATGHDVREQLKEQL